MKIRRFEKLLERLDSDFSWRRNELTLLGKSVRNSKEKYTNFQIRAGIALLYAHWEGFIKNAAEYYLTYVASQRRTHKELQYCFMALSLRNHLRNLGDPKASVYTEAIKLIFQNDSERANINAKKVIYETNLGAERLKELFISIGIDYQKYQIRFVEIDSLLKIRNDIAHGKFLDIDKKRFLEMHKLFFDLLVTIKEDIEDAAYSKKYLRNT